MSRPVGETRMTAQQVLVSGASGFVGRAVTRALIDVGAQVLGTWYRTAPDFQHPRLRWIRADLSSPSTVPECRHMDFDAVVHLAAEIPTASMSADRAAAQNRSVDERVFRLAAERRVPLVYASSSSVYGEQIGSALLSEDGPTIPTNPYSRAKLESERLGADIADGAGTRFVALRICAPYGPGQKTRTVVQIFVDSALGNRPLEYFGNGSREQAFTFVSDIASAFVHALHAGNGSYNIAGAPPIQMKNLALLVAELSGISGNLVRPAGRPDPQEGFAARLSIARAARDLQWSQRVSLREGLMRCISSRRAESFA